MTTTSSVSSRQTSRIIIWSDIQRNPVSTSASLAINIEAVQQSLDNLFTTKKYERPFNPAYYNPLEDVIGELVTPTTAIVLTTSIFEKIGQFEPRITLDNANSKVEADSANNAYKVSLVFLLSGDLTQSRYNYTTVLYTTIT